MVKGHERTIIGIIKRKLIVAEVPFFNLQQIPLMVLKHVSKLIRAFFVFRQLIGQGQARRAAEALASFELFEKYVVREVLIRRRKGRILSFGRTSGAFAS